MLCSRLRRVTPATVDTTRKDPEKYVQILLSGPAMEFVSERREKGESVRLARCHGGSLPG